MRSSAATGILGLLNPGHLDQFFENNWEKAPYLAPEGIHRGEPEILTLEQLEELMAAAPSASGLSIVEGHVARPITQSETDPERSNIICAALLRGCTVLYSGLQLRSARIRQICRDVENEMLQHGVSLAEGVGANAYLTPPNAQGFDIHYDNHCAIIIQLHGRKGWSVFAPIDELPIARCERPIALEKLASPILEAALSPGDVLYIPRGFPHVAHTGEDMSLHLTLSVRAMTWAEAIKALCESDALFRTSVRVTERDCTSRKRYLTSKLLPQLASMDVDHFLQTRIAEGYTRLTPLPNECLRAIANAKDIRLNSSVRRAPGVACLATEENAEATLRFPGACLKLPASMSPVFDFIAASEEFTAAMLPDTGVIYDRLQLVRILVSRGLLFVADRGRRTPEQELVTASAGAM
jgi:hypothetical protein